MRAEDLSEWAADCCCHHGSHHLVCSTSLWVHPQGFLSCTSPFLLCQMPSGIPPSSTLFPGHSVTHTHAGCVCCFPLDVCPSLLMLPAQVTPSCLYLASCHLAGWRRRYYSGEVILPAHDGYMCVTHVHTGIHMCMCTCICCVSCVPGAVAKVQSPEKLSIISLRTQLRNDWLMLNQSSLSLAAFKSPRVISTWQD